MNKLHFSQLQQKQKYIVNRNKARLTITMIRNEE